MATISEIAQKAGVSVSTVSRVLNSGADYTRPTFKKRANRIRRVASELGYMPNGAARAMQRGKYGALALVLSTGWHTTNITQQMIMGIDGVLSEYDYHLMVARLPDEKLTSRKHLPKFLREWLADGLLVNYTDHIPPAMRQMIDEYNIPAVWINTKLDADCVHPDDFAAGRRLAEELICRGHRDIAYADYSHYLDRLDDSHYSTADRLDGYEAAMREAGLTPRILGDRAALGKVISREATTADIRRHFEAEGAPTGVVTYGAAEAYATLCAACEMSLSPQSDLCVTTVAERGEDMFGIRLATMVIDQGGLGRAAAAMAMEKLSGERDRHPACALPAELVNESGLRGPRKQPQKPA